MAPTTEKVGKQRGCIVMIQPLCLFRASSFYLIPQPQTGRQLLSWQVGASENRRFGENQEMYCSLQVKIKV